LRHFDYAQFSTSDWENQILSLSEAGLYSLKVPLYWGHHEALQGNVDFQSKPRLKIEKLLALAQSLSVSLDFQVGFFDSERSFPAWSKGLPHQSLVPDWSASQQLGAWEFVRVPSFQNKELREAFLTFCKEALSILSLYRVSEGGTVKSVSFCEGLMVSEGVVFDEGLICSHFLSRYGRVENLNKAFQTNFNQFECVASLRGFRTLLEKRPWLACWEFKAIRNKLHRELLMQVEKQIEQFGLSLNKTENGANEESSEIYVFDDTPLEIDPLGGRFLPLAPQGQLNDQVLNAFQLNELLKLELHRKNILFQPMSHWNPKEKNTHAFIFCTKYLSTKAAEKITQARSFGTSIRFVFDKPAWDENHNSLLWPSEGFTHGGGLGEFI